MAVKALSLGTLVNVEGGQIATVWNNAMERAIDDCARRPSEVRARKIILQAEFVPSGEDGSVDDVEVTFQVHEKLPAFSTRSVTMKVRKRGQQLMLAFNDELEVEANE